MAVKWQKMMEDGRKMMENGRKIMENGRKIMENGKNDVVWQEMIGNGRK